MKYFLLFSVSNPITVESLLTNTSLNKRAPASKPFTPLTQAEVPTRGSIVGVDAEFVSLKREQTGVSSDGTHATLKPSQLSVARVSCVRGWNPSRSDTFLDDYISTYDEVPEHTVYRPDTLIISFSRSGGRLPHAVLRYRVR